MFVFRETSSEFNVSLMNISRYTTITSSAVIIYRYIIINNKYKIINKTLPCLPNDCWEEEAVHIN